MTNSEFYARIEDLIEVEPGTISGAESLNDMEGWDSLAVLSFAAMADEMFGITISAQQLTTCETVADLVKLFPGKISND